VDKRDGFPDTFYTADIVIVADPVQYHLDPAEQQIVGILAESILAGKAGDSLKEVAAFALDGGVTAHVYAKQKPYTHAFLNEIDSRMKMAYPDHAFINDTKSVYAYLYDLNLQSGKNIFVKNKYAFDMELGAETAGFKLNLEGAFNKTTLTITANNENIDGHIVRVTNDKNETLLEKPLLPGETVLPLDTIGLGHIAIEFLSDNTDDLLRETDIQATVNIAVAFE
jgi:hypothetical protein